MTGRMAPAGPARANVNQLIERGMTQQRIAEAGGVSPSALNALIHGAYSPGRPTQQTISAAASAQLLAVEYEEPQRRRGTVGARCKPSDEFDPAGHKVGRCRTCGELAWTRAGSVLDGYRPVLLGHPTRTAVSAP